MKVLVSAYACEPGKGSEPGVGWNWVIQISRFAELWVITRANNREVIEGALEREPLPNAHWVYFDLPRWARFWKRGQRRVHLYYYLWQICIYFVTKRLHREIGFDLVHHVTFGNYWMPSFLALLPVPFIWGPVGGGESAPRAFYLTFSRWGRLYEHARDLVRRLGELDPLTRMTARRAAFVMAKAKETVDRLERLGARNISVMSEVALPDQELARLSRLPPHSGNPFRLLTIGRLLHWKGLHLGIRAFAHFHKDFPTSEYWLIGEGPEQQRLERLAERLGVRYWVRFWGALARTQVPQKLAECDVLVHPSLHDSGGWACVEAMAARRPPICLDLGGPALQVTEETGFKIPADTPKQVVNELARAMLKLAREPNLLKQLGENACLRVWKEFCWEKRALQIKQVYNSILGIRYV